MVKIVLWEIYNNRPIGMKIQNAMGQVLYEIEINSDNSIINSFTWDDDKFPLVAGVYQLSVIVDGVLSIRPVIQQ